jgi:integrase
MKNVYDRWVYNRGENEGQPNPRTWGIGWRYRVRHEDVTGRLAEKTFPDGKKGEAQRFAAAQETHKNEGRRLDIKGSKQLIRSYGHVYVTSLIVTDSTRERYNRLLDLQVIPFLGGQQLIQCTSTTIQVWVRDLEMAGFSPKTIQLAYDFVCAMFKRAIRDRLIPFTPCEGITLPKPPDTEYWLPEHHQVHQLAATIAPRYKAAVYIGGGCGLRRGEVWGIDMDAIDFTKRTLTVRWQLIRPTGGGLPALAKLKAKNKAAYREVPIPDHTFAAIQEHVAAGYVRDVQVIDQTAKIRKGQSYPVVTKRMLFAEKSGKIMWPSSWNRMWAKARAALADMDTSFTFHGLRHYFASSQINAGVHVKLVAQLCGHSSYAVTLKVYAHLFKGQEEDARQVMNDIFAAGAKKLTEPMAHVAYLPDVQPVHDTEPMAA